LLRLFDLCDFDVVLVETVGVGQTELDILHVADKVGVVLVPESGDSIQAMKAGLMEVADFFIVNKADRPGASAMAKDIQGSFYGQLDGETPPPVYLTTATLGEGLDALVGDLQADLASKAFVPLRQSPERLRHEAKMSLRARFEEGLDQQLQGVHSPQDLLKLF
jgi:LAO/AO transport system kinase